MGKKIKPIQPFVMGLAYLSQEAERMELNQVTEILQTAENKLSRHCIENFLIPTLCKREGFLLSRDYKNILELFMSLSRMSEEALNALINLLEIEEKKMSKRKCNKPWKSPHLKLVKI